MTLSNTDIIAVDRDTDRETHRDTLSYSVTRTIINTVVNIVARAPCGECIHISCTYDLIKDTGMRLWLSRHQQSYRVRHRTCPDTNVHI